MLSFGYVTWTMQSSTALFLALSKTPRLPATSRPSLSADDSSAVSYTHLTLPTKA